MLYLFVYFKFNSVLLCEKNTMVYIYFKFCNHLLNDITHLLLKYLHREFWVKQYNYNLQIIILF